MKPSNFCSQWPYSSVLQNAESEQIATNCMIILKRTGDEFRPLSFDEYKEERIKDGASEHAVSGEKKYFDKVIPYLKSVDTARLFAPAWNEVQ